MARHGGRTWPGYSFARRDRRQYCVIRPGPRSARRFDGLQWTINGYTLTLAALILIGGSLGDRFGRRRMFVVGTVWFALASPLCALAPSVELLVAARALEGVGGALLTPGSLAMIQACFVEQDHGKAIGTWSGFGGIAAAIGPFVGGYLVAGPGWRWVFLINLPLAVVVVAIAQRQVPESRDPHAAQQLDVVGAVLGAVGLGGITYALIGAGGGWSTSTVLSFMVGLIALVAFVVNERRSQNPMLPPDIFGNLQFTAANIVTFVVYAALGGMFFFLVVDLQVVAGFSPILAGSALLPVTFIMLVFSEQAGALKKPESAHACPCRQVRSSPPAEYFCCCGLGRARRTSLMSCRASPYSGWGWRCL